MKERGEFQILVDYDVFLTLNLICIDEHFWIREETIRVVNKWDQAWNKCLMNLYDFSCWLRQFFFFPYIGWLLEQCPMVIHAHLDPSMLTWIHGSVTELDRHIRLLCNKNIARIQYKPTQVQQTTSDNGRGEKFHVCFS